MIVMTQSMKKFLAGMGSIMDVYPNTRYDQYIPKQSAEERMRSHWENTGNHIRKAIGDFEHEQKK